MQTMFLPKGCKHFGHSKNGAKSKTGLHHFYPTLSYWNYGSTLHANKIQLPFFTHVVVSRIHTSEPIDFPNLHQYAVLIVHYLGRERGLSNKTSLPFPLKKIRLIFYRPAFLRRQIELQKHYFTSAK